MQAVVQYILAGLAIGGIYALVALGFHIMWSAARAVNFAHGDTLMLGAVLAIMGLDAGLPLPIAIALPAPFLLRAWRARSRYSAPASIRRNC
jgi:branched-chain amino acid transport system permease protein